MPTVPKLRQVAPNPLSTPLQSGAGADSLAFGGGSAQALGGLGQSVGQSSNVMAQVLHRQEGMARGSDDSAFTEATSGIYRNLQEVDDFSPAAVDNAKANAKKTYDQILANHKGSPGSKEMLRQRLNQRMAVFGDSLHVEKIAYEDKLLDQDAQSAVNTVAAAIDSDPSVVTEGVSPAAVLTPHFSALRDQFAFSGLTPSQIEERMPAAEEELATSLFGPLIANGQIDRAREFLASDELKDVLSPSTRRQVRDRVEQAETALEAAKAAAANKGGEGTKLHFVEGKDGSVSAYNPYTGEMVSKVQGTPISAMANSADIKDVMSVQKEHRSASQDFIVRKFAYKNMRANAKVGGAGDMAVLVNFIKMNDPTSIVKESESDLAQALSDPNISGQSKAFIQEFLGNGSVLTTQMKNSIFSSAHATYEAALQDQKLLDRQFSGFATSHFGEDEAAHAVFDYVDEPENPQDAWRPMQFEDKGGTPNIVDRVKATAQDAMEIITGTPPSTVSDDGQEVTGELEITPEEQLTNALAEIDEVIGPLTDSLPTVDEIATMSMVSLTKTINALELEDEDWDALLEHAPDLFNAIHTKLYGAKVEESK